MQRVTMSLDEDLGVAFDEVIAARGYQSRSEGMRDLVREAVEVWRSERDDNGPCVASLSYVYDHHTRALAERLMTIQHRRHQLVVSTTHVHLDHDTCLETTLLRGPAAQVRALADEIRAERGVRFGKLNLVSVDPNLDASGQAHTNGHTHSDTSS